jgi:hypothetical protein
MEFIRLILLDLIPTIETVSISNIQIKEHFKIREVELNIVHIDRSNSNKVSIVLSAIMNADREGLISIDENQNIILSEELLNECHKSIEAVSNLISIGNHCRREIHSFDTACGLIPNNEQDSLLLESSRGIKRKPRVIYKSICRFDLEKIDINLFLDRLDGLSLLSEALSHQHATGRFHDLIRFFERSFNKTGNGLHNPMYQFLSGANLKFSKKEVGKWTNELRNPTTHAKDKLFLMELDVLPFVERMELAAYDILLNKLKWNNHSSERKNSWQPDYGPGDCGYQIFIKEGIPNANSLLFVFDSLGVYGFRNYEKYLPPDKLYTKFSEPYHIKPVIYFVKDNI